MTWVFSLPARPDSGRILNDFSIELLYSSYTHVIPINFDLVWNTYGHNLSEFDRWCQQYFCYYFYDRVWYDKWRHRWESNGIGGYDMLFIATNCDTGAMMSKLGWGCYH